MINDEPTKPVLRSVKVAPPTPADGVQTIQKDEPSVAVLRVTSIDNNLVWFVLKHHNGPFCLPIDSFPPGIKMGDRIAFMMKVLPK